MSITLSNLILSYIGVFIIGGLLGVGIVLKITKTAINIQLIEDDNYEGGE